MKKRPWQKDGFNRQEKRWETMLSYSKKESITGFL